MSDENLYTEAAKELILIYRDVKENHGKRGDLHIDYILNPNNQTLEEYGSFFKKENIENVTNVSDDDLKIKLKCFLKFKDTKSNNTSRLTGNHHWTQIHNRYPTVFEDMKALREALVKLLDDSDCNSIERRYNGINDNIFGMGKAQITAILLVAFKNKNGVWNDKSEKALKKLKLWPNFENGISEGRKYDLINGEFLKLLSECKVSHEEIDFWVFDALLYWYITGV